MSLSAVVLMSEQQQGQPSSRNEGHEACTQQEDVIAASRFSQQVIEQKERELQESIAINYTRIRDVEKELRALQMQVKLTAEPKKQALELLRSKIEVQNAKVQAVRRRYDSAKQAYEQLQSELDHEEGLKQQLCEELNQLVTTSVSSQLESFEQLKVKLEALHGTGAVVRSSSAPLQSLTSGAPAKAQQAVAAVAGPSGNGSCIHHDGVGVQQPAGTMQQQDMQQMAAQQPAVATAAVGHPNGQASEAAAAAEAVAARNRHVQLPSRSKHGTAAAVAAAAGSRVQQHAVGEHRVDGRFAGFEN